MDSVFLWAQVVGFFAMGIGIFAVQIKNPRHILLCGVPSALLWTIQYLMLGAPIGALLNLSSGLKDIALVYVVKRYIPYVIAIFLAAIWSTGLYSFSHWYDMLPLIAVTAVSIALLIDRDNRSLFVRAIIFNCCLWIVYNAIVGSWMGLSCAVMIIISSLISMARYEEWEIGKCYKSFLPSLARELVIFPSPRTYP